MVNSEKFSGTTEYLTLHARCRRKPVPKPGSSVLELQYNVFIQGR
jgi:hypothetical protein